MNKTDINKSIKNIINNLNNKNFDKAIKKIELISEEDLNFEILKKQIEIYKNNFQIKINKFKLFTNIGVILFKIGKINK